MSLNSSLSLEATFPPGYFLENLVSLPDDTLLVTVTNRKELYALPPPAVPGLPRPAYLLEKFESDQWTFGIALAIHKPSVVYFLTTDFTSTGSKRSFLRFLDVSDLAKACCSTVVMEFPPDAMGLNGLVALSETVLLAADSFRGVIWRIDVDIDDRGRPVGGDASVWLRDPTLDGRLVLPDFQPGVNGLKYSAACKALVFSSTQQRLVAKISVNEDTWTAVGPVVPLYQGAQADDLIIDDEYPAGSVAYVTTHRENSILRIPLNPPSVGFDPADESNREVIAEGTLEHPLALGPSAGVWKFGASGKTAYFTCDGGLKRSLPGEPPRYARVLRLEL